MKHNNRMRSATGVASYGLMVAMLLATCNVSPARACSTPVYRYAMYNWAPVPYHVFYFHHGQVAEEDRAVNQMLDALADAEPAAAANLMLRVVDASRDEQLQQLPEVVNQARQSQADGTAPTHLVFTPWGVELFAGRLEEEEVRAMVDSPARRRLGELLQEGNAAVLLILTGPDEDANKQAEEVVAKAAGEIPAALSAGGFGTPSDFLPPAPGDTPSADQDDSAEGLKLASLKVSRTDPAERWLVRALLSVEPDLHEFPEAAMIFPVYGRGRVMPPYIGKGITMENLTQCVIFLVGPCSCMVKEANPGMDLLIRWDWRSAADAMAAEDNQFGGGMLGYQEFVPDDSGDGTEASSPQDDGSAGRSLSDTEVADSPEAAQPGEKAQRSHRQSGSFAAGQVWKLGIGLAVGAIVVVGAGFMLIRRQRPG